MENPKATTQTPNVEKINGEVVNGCQQAQSNCGDNPTDSHAASRQSQDESLFLENAFLFLDNAELILSDRRMFLAPVPIINGLAYPGLKTPVLGVYLEWWQELKDDAVLSDERGRLLIYHYVGNPLTGSNSCMAVRPDGTSKSLSSLHFNRLWKTFYAVSKRYAKTHDSLPAFTLAEVVDILKAKEIGSEAERKARYRATEACYQRLEVCCSQWIDQYNALSEKHKQLILRHHWFELEVFSQEYYDRKQTLDAETEKLEAQRDELLSALREKKMTHNEYQRLVIPLKAKQQDLQDQVAEFKAEQIRRIVQQGYATAEMVEEYLDAADPTKQK